MSNGPQDSPNPVLGSVASWVGLFLGIVLTLALAGCSTDSGPPAGTVDGASEADSLTESTDPTVLGSRIELGTGFTPLPPPEVYVDPAGDDSNDGRTPATALRTPAAAVALAAPGDTVYFAAGNYPPLEIRSRPGTESGPIRYTTQPGAEGQVVFSSGNLSIGAGVFVEFSDHIVIDGLKVIDSLFGIWVVTSNHVDLLDNEVTSLGQEGIEVQRGSGYVDVIGNTVSNTGRRIPTYGEGIYLGQGGDPADGTHDVRVIGNTISNTTAEAIDIKAGVANVVVSDNTIHDINTANSGAIVLAVGQDVLPDPQVTITNNRIWNVTNTSPYLDGNGIVLSAQATVVNNVIWNVRHRGILLDGHFTNPSANQPSILHNTIYGAGLTPIEVRQGLAPAQPDIRNNLGIDMPGNLVAGADMFVDAPGGDFRLQPGTAAVDTAPNIAAGPDASGVSRPQGGFSDFGAHEIVNNAPPPATSPDLPPTTQVAATELPSTTVASNAAPAPETAPTNSGSPGPTSTTTRPGGTTTTTEAVASQGDEQAAPAASPSGPIPDVLAFTPTELAAAGRPEHALAGLGGKPEGSGPTGLGRAALPIGVGLVGAGLGMVVSPVLGRRLARVFRPRR